MKYYYNYDFYNLQNKDGLNIISHFKTVQQKTDYTCGPASVLMMLNYLDKQNVYTEADLAKLFNSRPYPFGTELIDIIKGIKSLGYKTFSTFDLPVNKDGLVFETFYDFKKFVIESIKNNEPILVLNVDYGGHYKVIIGYDEVDNNPEHDILIFADPLDLNDGIQDGYNYFPGDRFFYMWFDGFNKRRETKQGFMIIKK